MPGPSTPRRVDVAVVGAGLAGLTAATRLVAAGRSVAVLEARDRVGGRTFDLPLGGGDVVELGGQWAGPGQDRVLDLARELGVATFVPYAEGEDVHVRDGRRERGRDGIPPIGEAALAEVGALVDEIDALARAVPADRPWEAPGAAALDAQSIGTWLAGQDASAAARSTLVAAMQAIYAVEPGEVSLLELLASVSAVGGQVMTMLETAQSLRFAGGPQQLSRRLAERLGEAVVLDCPVGGLDAGNGVAVHAARGTWSAERAIVATPSALAGRLAFAPPLPARHDLLFQRSPEGLAIIVIVVYPRPFWREAGLSGYATADTGPIRYCLDNSPPGGTPGVLVAFFVGAEAARVLDAPPATRRDAVLEALRRWFGDAAGGAVAYHELVWPAEPFSRGAYCTYSPPGVLTTVGPARREPVGPIAFAGADVAGAWPGYMEGAIRSGEAAAEWALA